MKYVNKTQMGFGIISFGVLALVFNRKGDL